MDEKRNEKQLEPIRSLDFIDLLTRHVNIAIGEFTYVVTAYDVYEDHIQMTFEVSAKEVLTSFDAEPETVEVTFPREEGKRFYEFECYGNILNWDDSDIRLIAKPEVAEEEWKEINPWVFVAGGQCIRLNKGFAEHYLEKEDLASAVVYEEYYEWDTTGNSHILAANKAHSAFVENHAQDYSDNMKLAISNMLHLNVKHAKALRVEKKYAEHNLSEDCLAYAFYEPEKGYYIWNIEDSRAVPAFFELRSFFNWDTYDENGKLISNYMLVDWFQDLKFHCPAYCEKKGLSGYLNDEGEEKDLMRQKVMDLQKKELWEPGK